MDYEALAGLAIVTAFYKDDWCPGTNIGEILEYDSDLKNLVEEAENHVIRVIGENHGQPPITKYDVADVIWSMSPGAFDDYQASLASLDCDPQHA